MVPAAFAVLEAWPLTPNGKIDRRALPAPEGLHLHLETADVAPQNELERTIATVWQEFLHVEKVGRHENFFDLGGHSLLLVQIHSTLRATLNRDITLIDLFRHPTISSLAKYLSQEQAEELSSQQSHYRTEDRKALMQRQRHIRQRHQEVRK